MKLVKTPKKPTFSELREAGKLFPLTTYIILGVLSILGYSFRKN